MFHLQRRRAVVHVLQANIRTKFVNLVAKIVQMVNIRTKMQNLAAKIVQRAIMAQLEVQGAQAVLLVPRELFRT